MPIHKSKSLPPSSVAKTKMAGTKKSSKRHGKKMATKKPTSNGHAPLKLDILIVGAGITGLATAIACSSKGFNVTCLESASEFRPVGAGLMVSANGTRLLINWGMKEAMEGVAAVSKRTIFVKWDGSGLVSDTKHDNDAIAKEMGGPNWMLHRGDLHEVLHKRAKELGVKIQMGAKVKKYDWDAPSALLEDGSEIKADVILAADGYRSRSRSEMLGKPSEPRSAGTSAFRIAVPKALLLGDPEIEDMIDVEQQKAYCWVGNGKHILAYPVRNGEVYNIASTQPEVNTSAEGGKYVMPASKEQFQSEYAGWDPKLVKVLSRLPEDGILEWKLADLEPMDTWLFPGNKIALMGDACHPMLPSAAQGAGMGIEDGGAVAEFLARAKDKSEIPFVLKAWEQLRLPRCSSVVNTGREHAKKWHEKDVDQGEAPSYWATWGYDVITEAKKFPIESKL